MKKVLSLFLSLVFVIGICFSTPITIEAFAVENEVVVNDNLIEPAKNNIYKYQLTVDGEGYILHGPVKDETGAMHESITGEITLPTVHPDNNKPVVAIADEAFKDITTITSVVIPEGVIEIGDSVFSGCSNLSNVSVPDSITSVGEYILSGTIYYDDHMDDTYPNYWTPQGFFLGDEILLSARFSGGFLVLDDGLKVIAKKAAYGYTGAEAVIIPTSVISIGEKAFGYTYADDMGEEIVLNENFVIYGEKGSVAQEYAELNGIIFKETKDFSTEDWFEYKITEDGSGYAITALKFNPYSEVLEFPAIHNGLPVTEIHGIYYPGLNSIIKVVVPDSVKKIHSNAFGALPNLNELVLPEGIDIGSNIVEGTAFYKDPENWKNGLLYTNGYLLSARVDGNLEKIEIAAGTHTICANALGNIQNVTEVNLPDSVKIINDGAFVGCGNLKKVTGGAGIEKIGDHAFDGCTSLETVSFGASLKELGEYAFVDCSNLKSINLGDSIREIKNSTFSNCSNLESITIPDSVGSIGENAFESCNNINVITLGSGITTIGENAFNGAGNFTSETPVEITIGKNVYAISATAFLDNGFGAINVDELNPNFISENGVLYNKEKTDVLAVPGRGVDSIKIFADTVRIGAISSMKYVTSIVVEDENKYYKCVDGVLYNKSQTELIRCITTKEGEFAIPSTVTKICESAFYNCASITNITIPDTVKFIGEAAFLNCGSLETITLPGTLKKISARLFGGCNSLEQLKIPEGVISIGDSAFSGSSIKNVTLPQSLESIGESTFSGLAITSINIPKNVKNIGARAFDDCCSLTNLTIEEGVKDIGLSAFSGCSGIVNLTIPGSVKKIADQAFASCTNLSNLTIKEGVESIGTSAFANCINLQTLTLPESVCVSSWAFQDCKKLNTVTINSKNILCDAFKNCESLKNIIITEKADGIAVGAFNGTPFFDNEENWENGNLYLYINNDPTTKKKFWLAIDETVDLGDEITFDSEIYSFAYGLFDQLNIESVTIPGTLKKIPAYAFGSAELESIIIEEGVEYYGSSAFDRALCDIYLPSTIKYIAPHAFSSQSSENVIVSEDNPYFKSVDGVVYNKDFTELVAFPSGRYESYTMPENITQIADGAFVRVKCNSFVFNDNITEIPAGMFSYTDIYSVRLPASLKEIPERCFEGARSIENIVLPDSVTKIGDNAFYNCESLKSIELSDNLESIGDSAFELCRVLSDIYLPATVKSIGEKCFEDCFALETMVMPASLSEVPARCFAACAKLSNVSFSSSVENIAESAFFGCVNLKKVLVPETVYEIGEMALGYASAVIENELPDENEEEEISVYSLRRHLSANLNVSNGVATVAEPVDAEVEKDTKIGKVEDFTLYGKPGSEAEQYAIENELEFADESTVHICVPSDWVVEKATCTEDGCRKIVCTDESCGLVLKEEPIYSQGHIYENWTITKEAKCTENGERQSKCNNCDSISKEDIPVSHTLGDWGTVLEATCAQYGKRVAKCKYCDYTETDKISVIAHTFDERNICSACNVDKNDLIESEHPYETINSDGTEIYKTWEIHKEDAKRIAITFAEETVTEEDYDYIRIYVGNNTNSYDEMTLYGSYSGRSLAGERLVLEGNTVIIRLSTDGWYSEDYFGFALINVEYYINDCSCQNKELKDKKDSTCTEFGYTGDLICSNYSCLKLFEKGTSIPLNPHLFDDNGICEDCKVRKWSYSTVENGVGIKRYNGNDSNVTIPSQIDGKNVVQISSNAFSNTDVETVAIPETVEMINAFSFENAKDLNKVIISRNVTEIGAFAFAGCPSLKEVNIPNSIVNIAQQAFGYLYHEAAGEYVLKVDNFTIYGVEGSEAQRYAIENGFKFIVADEHTCVAGTEWLTENGYHYHKCESECDAKLDKADCSGGTATCKKKPICSTCEKEYGECDTTKHVEIVFGGTVGVHQKCKDCGVTTSTKHTLKESIQDSTCSKEGIKTFTCDCGYSYTVDVDKKEHTPINGGEKGIHSKCKDCGATLSTQHTYSRSETKATCEKAGTVKFSCSCGYYYTETTKATGHNSNTKITGKAATCTATGLTDGAKCSVCGKVTVEQKEIAKLSHNQNTKIAGKAATCTATGLTEGTKCSVCGTVTKAQQVIPATGHNQNTKIPAVAATCTKAGLTEGAKCSVCGTVTKAQQTIAATGHKITVVNKKDATTKEAGYTGDKVCSVCNAVTEKGTVIPKIIVSLATPNVAIKNTAKGIEVSWNAIENAKSYVVYRRVYDATAKKWSGWKKVKTGHTSTSYVDGTVVLGTGYRYTVRAVNGDVMSAYTSTKTLKYDVKPTVKISNVSNGVKVTWTTAANATGYTVYSSTYNTKTKKWSNWSNRGTAKATSTSWVDKKASSGVQYKYTVRACNGANIKSSYKASANLIYLAQPTVKIANASNGVRVSWNKIAGATSYYVYSAQFNPTTNKWSNWTNRGSVTTTSWTDTAVQSGVTYRYTVRAINGKTLSSYKATAGLIYLAQPTVKIANASTGVKVTWTQSAGATGYTVYRAEAVNGKWSSWKNMGTAKAEKSSWVDKSAKSGTKYKYTVRAVNGSVRSTYKATGELLYLAQPTVTVKAVSNGINVAWTQCTGAKGYTVYRSELVNGKWSNWKNMGTAKAEKSSWVDKSATAGVTYIYTVRAVNGKVRSTYVASTNVNR